MHRKPANKNTPKKATTSTKKKQPKSLAIVRDGWTKLGTTAKVISYLIGLLGLLSLIQLRPHLSANAAPPTDKVDVLGSSKFTITNDGYLKVTDVSAVCYFWHVRYGRGSPPTADINDWVYQIIVPPEERLSRLDSFTIPCTREGQPAAVTSPPFNMNVTKADIAIIVYYRAWPLIFVRPHSIARFVAHFDDSGNVTWEKQNPAALEPDFDKWLAAHGGKFPPIQLVPSTKP